MLIRVTFEINDKVFKEKYKDRIPNVEPRFAYNKYTPKYKQYHIKGQKSATTQQLLMATAQNMIKITT